jgi:tetraacyldisaccharide 4'-kinase
MTGGLAGAAAALFGAAWEARRGAYQRGWLQPRRVPCPVVSIGNLTVGGTGKTTLTLHLAQLALRAGIRCAVVCRDYRADAAGMSDEAHLYEDALADGREGLVYVGRSKRARAAEAAAAGAGLVLVDDGFSTWSLERDLDIVLLDARDLWGGGRLLPAGRLREPRRALQRAEIVVVSRLAPGEDPAPVLREVRGYAPAARLAAGRHVVRGLSTLRPWDTLPDTRCARVVTGTGNPEAVAASAREAGLEVTALARYRDHHWFTPGEVRHELAEARRERAVVVLTAKDAVRWEQPPDLEAPLVLEVDWAWVTGGEAVEAAVLGAAGVRAAEVGS